MNKTLSDDAKAILLLCADFGKKQTATPPLSQGKYNLLAHWLNQNGMRPGDLFEHQNDIAQRKDFPNKELDVGVIASLMNRGYLLAQTLEELSRSGIQVCCRSDESYPSRYKKRLRDKAPSFFYYAGNFDLAQQGGLAVVGSRNLDAEGEAFAKRVGAQCAEQGVTVISGGAKGADTLAMLAALEGGGTAIGVLCESLRAKSVSKTFRKFLSADKLLLLSPYSPDAPFRAWAAMQRNKLIYALSDGALVVSSSVSSSSKKSGSWEGATEELKRPDHLPVFVRKTDTPEGNRRLLSGMGGVEWPDSAEDIRALFKAEAKNAQAKPVQQASLFEDKTSGNNAVKSVAPEVEENTPPNIAQTAEREQPPVSLYEHCLPLLLDKLKVPLTLEELRALFLDIQKQQLVAWIKRAVQEKKIHKHGKPVRYSREDILEKTASEQGSLLVIPVARG